MTIFEKIIAREIPAFILRENDHFIAILDVAPLVRGHVLVIPKSPTDKIFDLDDDYLAEIMVFAQPIAKAIENTMDCKRCGISVVGLEVPHAHMHLVPINTADDLNFTRKKISISNAEMEEIYNRLKASL